MSPSRFGTKFLFPHFSQPGHKIAISLLNEFLELEDWLVEMVNTAAQEFTHFYEESPYIAGGTHMP